MAKKKNTKAQKFSKAKLLYIGLVLFIAGWMFVLGILVGRGTAPVPLNAHELEKELAALKAAILKKEQASIEDQAAGQQGPKPELGFYEALKKKPALSPSKVRKPVAVKKTPVKPESKPKPVKAKPVIKPKAQPPAAPKSVKPSAPATKQAGAQVDNAKYTIQVAAFRERQGAEKMVTDLRGKGYPAYPLRTASSSKGVWYRVRVGAFNDRTSAEKMLTQLAGRGIKGILVATK